MRSQCRDFPAHEIGSRMTAGDRQQTVDTVVRTLAHPLVSSAFEAQRMHYREGSMFGNPWLRLLRREVESLVDS